MSTNVDTITKKIRFSDQSPRGFQNWTNEHYVEDTNINNWIKECIIDIQEQILTQHNDVNPSAFRSSGNSIVTCIAYRKEENVYELTVVVARDYFSAVIEDFNPKKDYEFIQVK